MSFEKFESKAYHTKVPMITITSWAQFYINVVALEKYFLPHKYIELYFDREKNMVGLKPVDDESMGKIIHQGNRGNAVSAKSFMNHFNIDHSISRRYKIDKNGEFIVIGPVPIKAPGDEFNA